MENVTRMHGGSEALDPRQVALYRAASPTEKLAVVARINAALIAIKEAAVAQQHPEWSAEQRRACVRRWWFSARD